ncbi:MAG: hypothetical protein HZA54_04695 [Planctomycetes bacterium]|nr:hypothetical protein [Planctomycetota bacterium]
MRSPCHLTGSIPDALRRSASPRPRPGRAPRRPALALGLFLAALFAASDAAAQERVNIALKDGTSLTGTLIGFGGRIFQVQLETEQAAGAAPRAAAGLREIPEDAVATVIFLNAPGGPEAAPGGTDAGGATGPGAAARGANLLMNGGFEAPASGANVPGWSPDAPQTTPQMPLFAIDGAAASGRQCAKLEVGVAFGVAGWTQVIHSVPATEAVRIEGSIRTEGVAGCAFLAVLFLDAGGARELAACDTEELTPVSGTSRDWVRVALETRIPPGAAKVWVRAGMHGTGRAWFDDLALMGVAAAGGSAAAGGAPAPELGAELCRNRGFEEGTQAYAAGWRVDWPAGLPGFADQPQSWPRFSLDTNATPDGNTAFERRSARIDTSSAAGFDAWTQTLRALPAGAKRITVKAWARTKEVTGGGAQIVVLCRDPQSAANSGQLAFASTPDDRRLAGTGDWRPLELTLDLPEGTREVVLRIGLAGKGTVWFDNISVVATDGK